MRESSGWVRRRSCGGGMRGSGERRRIESLVKRGETRVKETALPLCSRKKKKKWYDLFRLVDGSDSVQFPIAGSEALISLPRIGSLCNLLVK
jgi:hypothetical protein